jgi:hypothetical protein
MIEILAIIYCSSLALSSFLLIWNLNSIQKQLRSKQLAQINLNLRKENLFWSSTEENLKHLNESNPQADALSSRRSCLMMALLGFASLPGFLLYLIFTISLSIIQSRCKKYIFESELARTANLNGEQVRDIVAQFKCLF